MSTATDTRMLMRAFVDELVRCGMQDACTSPGSRCTPIVLALAGERRLRCHSHIDERCSGFFALGLAKASGLPVALTCTSGTAVAELLPAAIEAQQARVPLLLLTADRPPELRENGAGQTIDQLKIFGSAAKWFFEVGLDRADNDGLRWMRTLACRAYWTALEGRPGVVHLNFPLREPLIGDEPLPEDPTARADAVPHHSRRVPRRRASDPAVAELARIVGQARRGVLIAGRHERGAGGGANGRGMAAAAAAFCETAGWPLLADPLSGARRGATAIAHYDALLRDHAFSRGMQPDVVLRVGDLPTSKPLRAWLAGADRARQIALDPEGAWQDPASVVAESIAVEAADLLAALSAQGAQPAGGEETTAAVEGRTSSDSGLDSGAQQREWLASWRTADARAAEAIGGVLAKTGLSEPGVAAELGVLLPPQATLFVASSMPVRDVESFWPAREPPPRVLCNRGANGIDGTVSSAFGAAAAGAGPVVLLIGDVALAHDIGGLLCACRLGLKLTIVLVNNDGGGIFDFLPVASTTAARGRDLTVETDDLYTRHIATPPGLHFSQAAALYGLEHTHVADVAAFRAALERSIASPRSGIVEVRTDRAENVRLHERAWQAVANALDGARSSA